MPWRRLLRLLILDSKFENMTTDPVTQQFLVTYNFRSLKDILRLKIICDCDIITDKRFVMIRKAFLIGAPQIEIKGADDGYLKGVTPDISNMKSHLLSNKGGAWLNSEIQTFSNPTREELLQEVSGEYDYMLLQYSGHGFEFRGNRVFLLLDYFDIAKSIALDELLNNFTAPRCFCFIDCCRGAIPEEETMSLEEAYALFSRKQEKNNSNYRARFDRIVQSCETGRTIIFSCSSNESAGEDPDGKGGYFSLAYLSVAQSAKHQDGKYYSVKSIFDAAVPKMKKLFPFATQHPVLLPERRMHWFPFTI